MDTIALRPDEFEGIAMIVVPLGLFVVLPIVSILTKHQRKMAEILNQNRSEDHSSIILHKLDQMQSEINSLKERQNDVILSLDAPRPISQSVENRIQQQFVTMPTPPEPEDRHP